MMQVGEKYWMSVYGLDAPAFEIKDCGMGRRHRLRRHAIPKIHCKRGA